MRERAISLGPEELLRHAGWVRRLAGRLVADECTADDLAQQTLLTGLERTRAAVSHPRAWLATVARSIAAKFKRASERRERHEARVAAPRSDVAAADVVANAQLHRTVVDAVLALEEPYRTAMLLRWFEEVDPREIATRLGVPLETVRTRLKRGLALLRARLAPRLGGEAGVLVALLRIAEIPKAATVLAGPAGAGAATAAASAGAHAAGAGVWSGAASSAAASWIGGATVVATKLQFVIAGVVIAGGGWATWKLLEDRGPRIEPPASAAAPAVEHAVARAAETPEVAASRAAEPAAAKEHELAPKTEPAPAGQVADATMHGTVRDVRGFPVAGAMVFLEQGAGHFGFEDAISFAREAKERLIQFERGSVTPLVGASGADGTFAFPLASGTTWNVGAIHRTSGVAWQIGVRVERDGAPVELVLEPGVVVHGTVRDEDGAPIAGASIGLDAVKKRVEGGTNSEGLGDLPTDDEGRYASPPLPVRDLLVRATKAGFLASPRTDATFAENEYDKRVDFTLKRSPRIHGRLLEPGGAPFDFARPIDRLSIHGCEQDPGTPDREYWNDALGALRPDDHGYELVPEWEGFHFIAVYAGDLLLGAAAIPEHGEGPDVVVDRSKLEARDAGKATLVLSVVDAATRESIPSFQLRHQSETFGYPDEPKTEGQLTLTGAPEKIPLPVGRHELTVRSEGYVPRRVTVDLPRGETPVEIALARADSRLTGRVLDQNDQPAAGVPVVLLGSDGRVVLPDDLGMVSTDDAGRFTFDSLASGDYLVVTGPSDAEGTSEAGLSPMSARVALRGGERSLELRLRDGVAVAFVVTTPGSETAGPLAFEIRDEAGALLVDDHRRGLWRSGSGQWWFRLPRGRHHIEVRSPGRRPAGADFTAEQGLTQRLELGPVEQ